MKLSIENIDKNNWASVFLVLSQKYYISIEGPIDTADNFRAYVKEHNGDDEGEANENTVWEALAEALGILGVVEVVMP